MRRNKSSGNLRRYTRILAYEGFICRKRDRQELEMAMAGGSRLWGGG